jgi:hypothetical protein
MDISDVSRPEFIWCDSIEVPLHEVRSGDSVLVPAGGSLPPAAHATLKTGFSHQSGNPFARAAHSQSPKLSMHPRVAINPSATLVDLRDLMSESRILSCPLGGLAILPLIVAAPRNPKYPAQKRDRIAGLLRVDELE